MGGNPHRNLRMFGKLCGDQAMKKVVLVTTMWDVDEADPQTHNRRERELFDIYWKKMIDKGASTARFLNSPDSAWEIIDPFLKQHETEVLLLQEELVDLKRALNETQAGKTLYSDLQILLASRWDPNIVRSLVDGAREQSNPQRVHEMEAKLKKIQKDSNKTFNDIKRLEIPLHRRLLLLVSKKSRGVRTINSSNLILLSTSLFCFNSGPCVYNTWWIGHRSLFCFKIFHLAIRAVVDIRNLVFKLWYGYDDTTITVCTSSISLPSSGR